MKNQEEVVNTLILKIQNHSQDFSIKTTIIKTHYVLDLIYMRVLPFLVLKTKVYLIN